MNAIKAQNFRLADMKNLMLVSFVILFCYTANAQQNTPTANGDATSGMVKKSAAVNSDFQTAQFEVWGNCGMCKKTIETAAKKVKGVKTAKWDVKTHQFTATYNPAKTDVDKIHAAIAKAGYDTDKVRGNDKAYKNLEACCQYDRKQ
ncbi:MAG: heavy-metal-associated domain-containing protein [Bacteroidota bacterium]|uniref:heavy-metal-associated domain-containing protein n=1 Tax=Runella sp. TaxID=1960881 RepID=UPI00301A3BE2